MRNMLGTIGFSYVGLIFLLMLFIPNMIWLKRQPSGYAKLAKKENKVLLAFERIGQVTVVTAALVFCDYNPTSLSAWTAWLAAAGALVILYEAAWLRYFYKLTLKNFYGSFLGIPVPMASLPVLAFLLLGIYGKVIWLIVATLLLGIGHIGIHIQHLRSIQAKHFT